MGGPTPVCIFHSTFSMYLRLTAESSGQLVGPYTYDPSVQDWPILLDLDLVVGPGRQHFASFTWSDLWAIAPWMEDRITRKIDGPGLGI